MDVGRETAMIWAGAWAILPPPWDTILDEVGMIGGRFEALFELERSLLYTFEMDEVEAFT